MRKLFHKYHCTSNMRLEWLKTHIFWLVGAMAIVLLLLAGCAPADPITEPDATATPVATATATAPVVNVTATPSLQPTPSSSPTPFPSVPAQPSIDLAPSPDASDQVINAARAALATYLGVAENTLTLVSTTPQEWSDGALGCPDPALGYTQAIVPGYLLVFRDDGQDYAIHTSVDAMPLILCQNGMPEILPAP